MNILAVALTSIALVLTTLPASAVEPEAGPVWDSWARTDLPVLEGNATRTWMWGPEANTDPMLERYDESPDGTRPVQYFDKARMEISDPSADPESPWYVTNGLLVVEMVTGMLQIGDAAFEPHAPATVNVAGDIDDADGPTYATFASLLDSAPLPLGQTITQTVDRDGNVNAIPELAAEGVTGALIDDVTDHSIAGPFWTFMNSTGTVYADGELTIDRLFVNPYFATGRPITEPYWTQVKVAGTVKWVLVQCFERRCLTYTPDNAPEWQVEAGNVGRHYLAWRYEDMQEPPPEPEPGETMTLEIGGIEIDAGDTEGDTTYGLRFIGMATGDIEGAMNVSLDYTPPNPGPGVVNLIVGGSWSITSPTGSLSGVIPDGSATWDGSVSDATITATFVITGATGQFAGIAGQGSFEGTLTHRFFPPRIGGVLIFVLEQPATAGMDLRIQRHSGIW